MKRKRELTLRQEIRIRSIKITAMLLAVLAGIYVYNYPTEYYPASDNARNLFKEAKEEGYLYSSPEDNKNLILKANEDTDTGILFYPGGKVEYIAYLPLLNSLREAGYDVVLIKMPYNLAFFDMNAAAEVITDMKYDLPNVKNWYIMGHSLGGVAASSYAAKFPEDVRGLILLGAYDYGGYEPTDTLVIYGSNDLNLNLSKIDFEKSRVYCIDGGNHAWFGDYGKQEGDGEATISHSDQQTQTVSYCIDWINGDNN